MGYAIAEELANQGANIILVSGPVSVSTKKNSIKVVQVESAEEMFDACVRYFPDCDGAVMTAAVADFTPANPGQQKTKRGAGNWSVELRPTKDIAAHLGSMKKENQLLAGFALETNDELDNARLKLNTKNFDFIVLNSLNDKGAGFGGDTNKITIIDKYNKLQSFELKGKKEVAVDVVEKILSLIG